MHGQCMKCFCVNNLPKCNQWIMAEERFMVYKQLCLPNVLATPSVILSKSSLTSLPFVLNDAIIFRRNKKQSNK